MVICCIKYSSRLEHNSEPTMNERCTHVFNWHHDDFKARMKTHTQHRKAPAGHMIQTENLLSMRQEYSQL